MRGDQICLRQVLINIIGNAVKFTDSGSRIVSVLSGSKPDTLHFAIKDTGIGITPEQLGKIFNPFIQADNSVSRRFGGTGLGTTISKQIVALMGGDIWAESEFGKGSTFHFTAQLPMASLSDLGRDNANPLPEQGAET